jgi:hypothetical protein
VKGEGPSGLHCVRAYHELSLAVGGLMAIGSGKPFP